MRSNHRALGPGGVTVSNSIALRPPGSRGQIVEILETKLDKDGAKKAKIRAKKKSKVLPSPRAPQNHHATLGVLYERRVSADLDVSGRSHCEEPPEPL